MTAQLALDLTPLTVPTYEPEATIQQRFEQWEAENPWVMRTLEHLVDAWLSAGHSRVGIKSCWEQIRWQYGVTTGDTFKANNSYTSRAARLLIQRRPDLAAAIETRELRAS
jgi:hypothetical protein